MSNYENISRAISAAMAECDGLPTHVYVHGLSGARQDIDDAAEVAQAWVREYDADDGVAVVACR